MNMKKIHFLIALCGCIFAALSLSSCEDDIDVDGTYPFTVETMPVPTRLAQGETAEIRCRLKREGRFSMPDTPCAISSRMAKALCVWMTAWC